MKKMKRVEEYKVTHRKAEISKEEEEVRIRQVVNTLVKASEQRNGSNGRSV